MIIGEYILLGVLLLAALFLVVAVTLQKSGDEGLSGTIAGGSETYYGKDKSVRRDKILGKWTLIISLIFALVVLVVYVIQPDYPAFETDINGWQNMQDMQYYIGKNMTEFSYIFTK